MLAIKIYNPHLCNRVVHTFEISNLYYLMEQNSEFEITKVYEIGLKNQSF